MALIRGLVRQLLPALGSAHQAPALSMASSQQLRCMGGGHDEHDDHHDDHPSKPAPSVFDKLVEFSVIDLKGKRRVVKGIVGKRLSEALVEAKLPSTYFFPNMGFYTQHIVDAHVFLPRHLWHTVPNINPNGEEADAIVRMFRDIVQDYQKDTSYFASYVRITHDMEGATIGIGPIKPWILHSNWYFDGVHKEHAALVSAQGVIWG